jgi:esterase/lipase
VSDIRDADARARHPGCDPFPISAFVAFDDLRHLTRTIVRSVRQPALIVLAEPDRICTLAGAEWLRGALAASQVEMHVLRESGHVITVDREGQAVARLVADFVDRTIGLGGPLG